MAVTNFCNPEFSCSQPTLSILLGNGDGTFEPHVDTDLTSSPYSVTTADFNGDGKLDLAIASNSTTVTVFLGTGDGTFEGPFDYPATGGTSVITGDFNADGKLDLATTGGNIASILLGNGDGTFQPEMDFSTGPSPLSLVAGDFNSDGRPDLATANDGDSTVSVLLQQPQLPAASLSPASLTFATQVVNTTSAVQKVTLTNTGSATLLISSVAVSGDFLQRNTCGSGVGPGSSCTISVALRPKAAGARAGALTITDDASNSPQTVTLSGTGTFFSLSPTSLAFGNQTVGATSPPQTVTLTNVAKVAQNLGGVRISGTNPSDFAQTNNCGTSIAAGASCTFSVTFTPTKTGKRQASLQLNGGGGGVKSVTLSGTGKEG